MVKEFPYRTSMTQLLLQVILLNLQRLDKRKKEENFPNYFEVGIGTLILRLKIFSVVNTDTKY